MTKAEKEAAAKKEAEEKALAEHKAAVEAKALELSGLTKELFDGLAEEEQAKHIEAAEAEIKAAAEAAAKAAEEEQANTVKTVRMVRDAEQYPAGPHESDVHPDEVENFKAGGWNVAE